MAAHLPSQDKTGNGRAERRQSSPPFSPEWNHQEHEGHQENIRNQPRRKTGGRCDSPALSDYFNGSGSNLSPVDWGEGFVLRPSAALEVGSTSALGVC